ncbi:MAG TPA: IPT/TIG domain-containing protein, partial [Urbifossiella sp.]|nr:IPT/TIG domain-containing protein [Urbifossiella sp.]
ASAGATITVAPAAPPAAPTGLTASAAAGQVTLSWAAAAGAVSYSVVRGPTLGGEGPTPIATGLTGTSYQDTAAAAGTTYYYTIEAVDPRGASGPSNEAAGTEPPAAPAGVTAAGGPDEVTLSWAGSAGATSYQVFRGTTPGGEGATPIANGLTGTSYQDTAGTAGTTYYYTVAAVDAGGRGLPSAEASATPSSAPHGPSVAGLSPAAGPISGGTTVTITGANLGGTTAFEFGSAPATILSVTPTQIVVTAPAGAVGAAPVTVITPAGTATSSYTFTLGQAPGLVGVPPFAVGSDTGGPATATEYNPDGSVAATFDPFPGTTGGVRTAVGDFNGDGTPDVAFGTGPGAVAEVKVLDGKTGAVLFDVPPFADFTGGVFVAAGDVTGDGKADLVITPDLSGGPRVEVYSGADFAEVANFFGIDDPNFRGGARAGIGDVNGDGHADLVISAGFGGGPRISVYDGAALTRGDQVHLVSDFFLFEQTLRNGCYVAVGDVNGDGFADLIGGGGPGGGPRVLVISGETLLTAGAGAALGAPVANFFAGDTTNRGGVRVAAKNLDGDPDADVIAGAGTGGGSGVTAYPGKNLAAGDDSPDLSIDAFAGFAGGVYVG